MAAEKNQADTGTTVWWFTVAILTLPWIWPFATGPWPAAQQAIVTLVCSALLLLCVTFFRVAMVQAVAMSWLVAAVISSLMGLAQYFGLSPQLQPWVDQTMMGEAFGNLRQRNQLATLICMGLAVLLWGPLAWPSARQRDATVTGRSGLKGSAAVMPLALLLAVANAATASRTGLIHLGVLTLLACVWNRGISHPSSRVLIVACAGYLVAAFALPLLIGMSPVDYGIGGRLRAEGLACGSRRILWGNVLQLIAQEPWLGWGWGELDYAHFMAQYSGLRFCEILDNAHNLPLHLAVELGLPLALGVSAIGVYLLWRGRPWRELDRTRRMAWAVLGLILLHSMLEYPLWYAPFQLACALVLWMLLTMPATTPPAAAGGRIGVPPKGQLPVGLCAGALLSACAYAAWDYWRVSQIYTAPESRATAYMSNPLEKVRGSWLFANQVRFGELVTTDLTATNATQVYTLSKVVLHFSPESRVVEKLIESAVLLGHDAEAATYMERYKAAFPKEYARWARLRLLAGPDIPARGGPPTP